MESGSGRGGEDGAGGAAVLLTDHLPSHEDAAHGTGGAQLPLCLQPLGGEAGLWQRVPVAVVEGHLHRFGVLGEGLRGLCEETEVGSTIQPGADLFLAPRSSVPLAGLHQLWPNTRSALSAQGLVKPGSLGD